MSRKSKKKKRRRLSSTSSEEEEKKSKKQGDDKDCTGEKKKQHVKTPERDKSASSAIKDVSQSTRLIKKPVYRLRETHATDQKPVNKEEERGKTKSVTVPSHREHCSSKAKHDTSGKDNSAGGNKPVDKGTSKPTNTNKAVNAPQRTQKTSEGSPDEKSSQRSPSRLRKPLTSPSLVSDQHKKQVKDALKRKHTAVEPPRTKDNRDSNKAKELRRSFEAPKDCVNEKRINLCEEKCQKYNEKKLKAKTEVKHPSASTKESSSTSANHTTSASSKVAKNAKFTPVSFKTVESSSAQQQKPSPASLLKFKIPKLTKARPLRSTVDKDNTTSANTSVNNVTEPLKSNISESKSKQKTVQNTPCSVAVKPTVQSEGQDKRPSFSGQPPATSDSPSEPCYNQKVVEELHLARSEKRLELNVMQSYGELTCMDIDPPEEVTESHSGQPLQQDLILVLDTNILISHLSYVKKIRANGLEALGFPVIVIPWVVLQELDSLKRGGSMSSSVAHQATPAISYICNTLKNREPRLWGQSMQQAARSSNDLKAENNDDRVLQCCLQYQALYPECALILCTNDKNLCSKALLSGVNALNKDDLEAEVVKSRHGSNLLQNIKTSTQPQFNPPVSSSIPDRSFTFQPPSQERAEPSVQLTQKDQKQQSQEEDKEQTEWDLGCVSALEKCLCEVLSDILEVEMKSAFEELWLEIVYLKPPWTLDDILQCLKKHWIAVFGHVVPRRLQHNVNYLINFFNSGKKKDSSAGEVAVLQAQELLKAFGKRSKCIPGAISVLDKLLRKLHSQAIDEQNNNEESPTTDVVMNDDDEEEPTSAQVSHQEVWALFENIWDTVFNTSLEVFKALGFDPHTMQRAQPAGGPPPPQDALVCLQKLSSVVTQLLQGFSSVLYSAPGSEEAFSLFSIIHSIKIVEVDSRLAAQHLQDCFSQQEYREKLQVGGIQLTELKGAIDHCGWTFTTQS
ncbi:transcriptional protein SWT1 [Cheilinus undulatus]|uniref:transcriptional protein SWT1 n=1 Tax=Cheilinus undulatus TaxID=241271 RepID=UPI001BD341D7|nr:transcriptional protein SWT1 [Cheilinus undulatus]